MDNTATEAVVYDMFSTTEANSAPITGVQIKKACSNKERCVSLPASNEFGNSKLAVRALYQLLCFSRGLKPVEC